ncbi:helicase C-terminal domain-containing protein [Neurospora hispaniola]|uniref:ATP-dependent DNA helicase CHL1 n=1 Tax=Neurospora hispaniola TaxID=588809 RepID=A0AAJ0HYR0_9PEZI|nr:helicase C-terminal domain-containing protein [Neurospora hispaniola]
MASTLPIPDINVIAPSFIQRDSQNSDNMRPPPTDFNHPYTPYPIQTAFMQTLYSVLDRTVAVPPQTTTNSTNNTAPSATFSSTAATLIPSNPSTSPSTPSLFDPTTAPTFHLANGATEPSRSIVTKTTTSKDKDKGPSSSSSVPKGHAQIALFESPTGTGKSLSLICGSLTWLRNHKRLQFEAEIEKIQQQMEASGEPEWMVESAIKRKWEELAQKYEEMERTLERIRQKEREMEKEGEEGQARGGKRRKLDRGKGDEAEGGKKKESGGSRGLTASDEDKEFLIGDWRDEGGLDENDPMGQLSKETRELLEKVGMGTAGGKKEANEGPVAEEEIKIFYTSRTHSQLTQFIQELRRPGFPASVPTPNPQEEPAKEIVKQIPLSSRQKLCINPTVNKLGTLAAINERCQSLQQPKTPKEQRCPYLPNAANLKATHEFRDTALATLPDIEDLYQTGKQLQICPYYASRAAIPGAEVITLPYPLLLQKSAREALGIKLEGNIVIIDEAHNIMDAVSNVHAAEIKYTDLKRAKLSLGMYYQRFHQKLTGENKVMVAQLQRVVEALGVYIKTKLDKAALGLKADQEGIVLDTSLLLKTGGADQINLYKLIRYVQESKLAFKIEGYISYCEEEGRDTDDEEAETEIKARQGRPPVLHTLCSFLTALTNLSSEGRIFYEKIPPPRGELQDMKLSYMLLSPTHAFSSIAESARAVILAGGTMSPFEDYKAHLFPDVPPEKITTLSCGHVIPPDNLCVWTLGSIAPNPKVDTGIGEDCFDFTFAKRSNPNMINRLGLVLLNLCSVVPDGVVAFFPSYGYLEEVIGVWKTHEQAMGPKTIWERLESKKALFIDSKTESSEQTLQKYSDVIHSEVRPLSPAGSRVKGAMLLSVIGGKMSEGINFSDRLGRCVIVVGMPYPNPHSPEWLARREYLEANFIKRYTASQQTSTATAPLPAPVIPPPSNTTHHSTNPSSSRNKDKHKPPNVRKLAARDSHQFYENATLRAVNQSIGRAIRHQNDYAAIVLIDNRFEKEHVRAKLPGWIREGWDETQRQAKEDGKALKGLQGMMGRVNMFFRGKN